MYALWNTVHEQAAHAIITVVDGNPVAGFVELVRGRKAGGTRANDRDRLARAELRDAGCHPAHLEALKYNIPQSDLG